MHALISQDKSSNVLFKQGVHKATLDLYHFLDHIQVMHPGGEKNKT